MPSFERQFEFRLTSGKTYKKDARISLRVLIYKGMSFDNPAKSMSQKISQNSFLKKSKI